MSENTTTVVLPTTAPVVTPAATKAIKPRTTVVKPPVVKKETTAATPAAKKETTADKAATPAAKAAVKPRVTAKPVVSKVVAPTAPAATKATTKPSAVTKSAGEFKFKPMALAAGIALALTDKRLKKALNYHTKTTGCLAVDSAGKYALTSLGEQAWQFQRVQKNPELWLQIANFVRRNGPTPNLWKNQPPVEVAAGVRLPNPIFWGSFSSDEMRLAWAALWSK